MGLKETREIQQILPKTDLHLNETHTAISERSKELPGNNLFSPTSVKWVKSSQKLFRTSISATLDTTV